MTMTQPSSPALSTGCRLVTTDGRTLPLVAVDVRTDAAGGLARVRLRQTFANPYTEPLAVTYLLPLPADGAVVDFAFVLDGRRVCGRVARRADARAAFEQAVLQGRTASLLEQDRSSLFTQELGNLPPGAAVEVEIDVEQPLAWAAGGWEWRWPTVVGPRYLGAPGETPDADRVTVDVASSPIAVRCTASVTIGDTLTGAPSSPSHAIGADGDDGIALSGALDRDIMVRWPVAAPEAGVRTETARPIGDTDAYGLVTLVPPAVLHTPVSRDLCLLLDTSGSMSGAPLAQLQAFSTALVEGLRDGDRLELLEFSNVARRWKPAAVPVDARSRAEALAWIGVLRAGGGTAMHEAVTTALETLRPEAQRQVVLMTDGYIGFEREVIGRIRRALPRGSRIHTVGIGSGVNRTLTGGVARAGGGHEAIVAPDEAVGPAVAMLLARTGDPLWIDVEISGDAVRRVAPAAIPDLLAGAPARIAVRLDPRGGSLVVTARTAAGPVRIVSRIEPVAEGAGRRVLVTRFAREAVEDLEVALAGGTPASEVDPAIEALGLRYRLATRMTSWVAETEETTVDPGDPTRWVKMPHLLPHGVSAEGVGLRRSVAQPRFVGLGSAVVVPAPSAAPGGQVRRRMEAPPPPGSARSAPAPMSPPKTPAEAQKKSAASLEPDRSRSKDEGPAAPAPEVFPSEIAAPKLAEERASSARDQQEARPVRRLLARIVSSGDGRLVLAFEVDGALDWDPSRAVVVDADGHRLGATIVNGTTRTGALVAGQVARLVLGWTGPTPLRIEIGDLTLVFA